MKFVVAVITLSLAAVSAAQAAKTDCPPGQYYDISYESCEECDEGSFKAAKGPHACSLCPENAFSRSGATKCIQCAEGKALMKRNKCGTCPPGTYLDNYGTMGCKKCGTNNFQPYENIKESCFVCAGDTNSPKGATSCNKCPAGTAIMKDGKCGVCPPGTFYRKYRQDCKMCKKGTFQPNENIREDECPVCSGDTASEKGATKCLKCPFGMVPTRGKCLVCRQGFGYFDGKCTKCQHNEYSSGQGIFQKCKSCRGSFYSLAGATECRPCPEGTALVLKNGKAKCLACPTGSSYQRYSAECEKCFDTSGGFATGARGISSGGDTEYCTFCPNGLEPNADKTKCV